MAISKTTATAGAIGGGLGIAVIGGAIYLASTGETESTIDSPVKLEDNVEPSSSSKENKLSVPKISHKRDTLVEIKKDISDWAKGNGNCKIRVKLKGESKFTEIEQFNNTNKKTDLESLYSVLNESENGNKDAKDKCTKAGINGKMEVEQKTSSPEWTFKIETLNTIKSKITSWVKSNGDCTIKVKLGDENAKELNEFTQEDKKSDLMSLYSHLIGSGTVDAKSKCKKNSILEASKNNKWTLTQTIKE